MRYFTLAPALMVALLLSGCANLGIYRLELEALPQQGQAPVTVAFNAEIKGGLDTMPELYCKNQTWDFGDGQRRGVIGLCRAWRPGMEIDRQFGLHYTYKDPGAYEMSVQYGPLQSEPVQVTVMK